MATAAVTNSFAAGTLIESAEANTNFQDLVTFLNNQVIHSDASKVFTAVPTGPAADPVSDNQFTRKKYVDVPWAVATLTTGAVGVGGQQALTGWTVIDSRGGTWTPVTSGLTPPSTGVYMVGLNLFFNGLSVTPQINAVLLAGATMFAAGQSTWNGQQPSSDVSCYGMADFGVAANIITQFSLSAGTGTSINCRLTAVKVAGTD